MLDFMIKVQGLKKSYGAETLFENVNFQLNRKERLCLIGKNGCGKSTIFRLLTGEESKDAGEIQIPKNYVIGHLEQHILFTKTTLRQEAALALRQEERATPYRVEAILSGLGFQTSDFMRDPKEFSQGYQLRIQLAKTLVKEPDCLLLDEPTNYLDVVSIRWLQHFLKAWKSEMIIISHDRSFLDAVATHIMGFHRKKLYQVKGKSQDYYDHILQIEKTHEKTRIKLEKQKQQKEEFILRFGAKATKAKQAKSMMKAIDRLPALEKLTSLDGLNFHFHEAPFRGKKMVEIANLHFQFNDTPLIQNLSFTIGQKERFAIIGKNGRGKSTLLRLLSQELNPSKGTITYAKNLAIGFFGQTNIKKLQSSLTVEEEVQRANPSLSFQEVRQICGQMLFSKKQYEKKIGILSGGEKSRVLLGKIIATPCNFLLLDEPSNHLDIESVEALMEALVAFSGSLVIVSHDEEILSRIPDKLIICHQGNQLYYPNDYRSFLENVGWDEPGQIKRQKKVDDIREIKKKKAVLIQERSKILKPLKQKISQLEKIIAQTEKEISILLQAVKEAVEKGNNKEIAELTKEIGKKQKLCDNDYTSLDELYKEMQTAPLTSHNNYTQTTSGFGFWL